MDHGPRAERVARLERLKGESMYRRICKSLAAGLAASLATVALAQGFPTRPIKIVVPFAPGGNLDVTARIVAEHMTHTLGQPLVIENRPGAGGAMGSEAVSKAQPDGYTLVAGTTATTIVSPMLIADSPYRLQSFAPVGMMAVAPLLLVVPANSPFTSFKSFVAQARANPGKVTMGHSGNGTTNHIAVLQLQDALKVRFNVVPYRGSGPALIDLLGGQIDAAIDQTSSSLPHIKARKLRALAIATRVRIGELPSTPTMQEEGLADFEAVTPSGLFAPARTPPEVLRILNAALNKALADPSVRDRLAELSADVRPMSVEQFDFFLHNEEIKLQALVKSGALKGD
jgi:tripartite-type tricarboxylate transporter receptor subunit TctC